MLFRNHRHLARVDLSDPPPHLSDLRTLDLRRDVGGECLDEVICEFGTLGRRKLHRVAEDFAHRLCHGTRIPHTANRATLTI